MDGEIPNGAECSDGSLESLKDLLLCTPLRDIGEVDVENLSCTGLDRLPKDLIEHHLFSFVTDTRSFISLRTTCKTFRDYFASAGILQVKLNIRSYMQRYGGKMDRSTFLKTIIQGFPTTSSITINFYAHLSDLHLFSNLKSIIIEENATGRLSDKILTWPQTLTHLEMSTPHSSPSALQCLENIPKSVVSLKIKNGTDIRKITRGLDLQHLRFEGEVNTNKDVAVLPNTLTSLEILFTKPNYVNENFLKMLPTSLLELRLTVNPKATLTQWVVNAAYFPKSLRSLALASNRENDGQQEVLITGLPTNLSILDIELKKCISMRTNILPPSLLSLRLVRSADSAPLNLKLLPSSLRYIDLRECNCSAFNFHSNLRYISITGPIRATAQLIFLDLPPQLKYLHLDSVPTMDADKFELLPRHLWGLVLLNVLTVELSCEQIGKLPPSLRYFECNTLSTSSATIALEKLQFMDRKSFCQKLDRAFWNLYGM